MKGKEFKLDWTKDGDDQFAQVDFIKIRYESCVMTWDTSHTSVASYEAIGETYTGSSITMMQNQDGNCWHSKHKLGPRGIKVTFEKTVRVSHFTGPYFNLLSFIKEISHGKS